MAEETAGANVVETATPTENTAPETASQEAAEANTEAKESLFQFPEAEEKAEAPAVEETKAEAKEAEETALPEKYEFHLPEGLTLSPEIEQRFTEMAKGLKLTQEQADGLVKLHSDIMLDAMKQAEAQKNAMAQECHKAGLTTPDKLKMAKLAIDTFDDSGEVMQVLIDSGAAYHPAVQRMLQAMGGVLSEDSAPDSKPAAQAKSAAELLFQNSKY